MKDSAHHLKHIQKKIIKEARKESLNETKKSEVNQVNSAPQIPEKIDNYRFSRNR